jgi:hypothetical protein
MAVRGARAAGWKGLAHRVSLLTAARDLHLRQRGDRVKRREFITSIGGAAAWPLAARAQQRERIRHIGVLMNRAADNPEGQDRLAAFHQGLQELGWNVGRNARIDTRWSEDNADRSAKYAAELLGLTPDIILASGTLAVTALQHTSRTLPIVFAAVADPVGHQRREACGPSSTSADQIPACDQPQNREGTRPHRAG